MSAIPPAKTPEMVNTKTPTPVPPAKQEEPKAKASDKPVPPPAKESAKSPGTPPASPVEAVKAKTDFEVSQNLQKKPTTPQQQPTQSATPPSGTPKPAPKQQELKVTEAKQPPSKPSETKTDAPKEVAPKPAAKVADADKYHVAVVDVFNQKTVHIDDDRKPDLTHGRTIVDHLKTQLGDDLLPKTTISERGLKTHDVEGLTEQLKLLQTETKAGKRLDAINLSQSAPAGIADLGEIAGIKDLNKENIAKNRDAIRGKLDEWGKKKDLTALSEDAQVAVKRWQMIQDPLKVMEGMDSKTKIYVSNGNWPNYVNLFSFAKGDSVVTVGGLDERGRPARGASNSSLDNTRERSEFSLKPIYDGKTLKGVDYTGDGKVDATPDELSGTSFRLGRDMGGTSYSTAASIAKALRQKEKGKEAPK